GHRPGGLDDLEAWRRGGAEPLVERGQFAADELVTERVDDDDRLARAVIALLVQPAEVVRPLELGRRGAPDGGRLLTFGSRRGCGEGGIGEHPGERYRARQALGRRRGGHRGGPGDT